MSSQDSMCEEATYNLFIIFWSFNKRSLREHVKRWEHCLGLSTFDRRAPCRHTEIDCNTNEPTYRVCGHWHISHDAFPGDWITGSSAGALARIRAAAKLPLFPLHTANQETGE